MAKKSLGYVQLEWTCPNCSTRNPGSRRTCQSCGMPQPDDVTFEQPAQEKIVTDEAQIAAAKRSPDIHCHYCGTRNPANAETCSQCGADLSEGAKRQHGQILGAHRDQVAQPVNCPACGTPNDPAAPKCVQCGASLTTAPPVPPPPPKVAAQSKITSPRPGKAGSRGLFGKVGLIILVLVVCAGCAVFYFLSGSTEDLTGTVDDVSWQRSVTIERLVPVTEEAWHDQIPAEGEQGSCTLKLRRTQPEPTANAKEVCGTPYTVDTGTGFGEVVQDCQYEIYEEYCEYQLEEWREDDEQTISGSGFSARWPDLALNAREREGDREERYTCHFTTENGEYNYVTTNFETFQQCQIGSRWTLQVNTFDTVVDIEPLR